MTAIRWISFLPLGLVCGYLAYLIGGFINNLTLAMFFGPLDGWLEMVANFMAHMCMAGAFLYSAVWIAPSGHRNVAVGVFMLILVFAGTTLWLIFSNEKFYALPSIAGLLFGGVSVLYSVWRYIPSLRQ